MSHPFLSHFIRNRVVAGLMAKKNLSRADAESLYDSSICDQCLAGAFADAGIEAPAAGVLAWLLANLPAVLKVVAEIIAILAALAP